MAQPHAAKKVWTKPIVRRIEATPETRRLLHDFNSSKREVVAPNQ